MNKKNQPSPIIIDNDFLWWNPDNVIINPIENCFDTYRQVLLYQSYRSLLKDIGLLLPFPDAINISLSFHGLSFLSKKRLLIVGQ